MTIWPGDSVWPVVTFNSERLCALSDAPTSLLNFARIVGRFAYVNVSKKTTGGLPFASPAVPGATSGRQLIGSLPYLIALIRPSEAPVPAAATGQGTVLL